MVMLEVNLRQPIDLNLSIQNIVNYANHHGWHQFPQSNPRLTVFRTSDDDYGNPILLVLPSHENFEDAPLRLAEAVQLLAAVENRTTEEVLTDIQSMGEHI
jgi:hypothetical protein